MPEFCEHIARGVELAFVSIEEATQLHAKGCPVCLHEDLQHEIARFEGEGGAPYEVEPPALFN